MEKLDMILDLLQESNNYFGFRFELICRWKAKNSGNITDLLVIVG